MSFFENIGPKLPPKYQYQINILRNMLSMNIEILKQTKFAIKI